MFYFYPCSYFLPYSLIRSLQVLPVLLVASQLCHFFLFILRLSSPLNGFSLFFHRDSSFLISFYVSFLLLHSFSSFHINITSSLHSEALKRRKRKKNKKTNHLHSSFQSSSMSSFLRLLTFSTLSYKYFIFPSLQRTQKKNLC